MPWFILGALVGGVFGAVAATVVTAGAVARLSRPIIEPCWKYVNNSIEKQLLRIRSESGEMLEELADSNMYAALIEMLDVYQSCVTGFEVFRRHGFNVDAAMKQMIEKNKRRGYYDEP